MDLSIYILYTQQHLLLSFRGSLSLCNPSKGFHNLHAEVISNIYIQQLGKCRAQDKKVPLFVETWGPVGTSLGEFDIPVIFKSFTTQCSTWFQGCTQSEDLRQRTNAAEFPRRRRESMAQKKQNITRHH